MIVCSGSIVSDVSKRDNGNGIFEIIDNHINKTYLVSHVSTSFGSCFSNRRNTGKRSAT